MHDPPYYSAYDTRYRTAYAAGAESWAALHPGYLDSAIAAVREFLVEAATGDSSIAELGCGEGYVGEAVALAGFAYTGFDISEAAIGKAKARLQRHGSAAEAVCADVLHLDHAYDGKFNTGIDIGCLHMLVTDADRAQFLRTVRRLLKPGACVLWRESHRHDAPGQRIDTPEQWESLSGVDRTPVKIRIGAGVSEKMVSVPRFSARGRSVEQYSREFTENGHHLLRHVVSDDGMSVTMVTESLPTVR